MTEFWSHFKFAKDSTSLYLDLPLLVVVSWETDAMENLEHRRRGGESVLRTACDTRASTRRQTVFSSSSSSLLFVVCSTFYYYKIIVILFMCNIDYINSSFISVLVYIIIITPIFYLTKTMPNWPIVCLSCCTIAFHFWPLLSHCLF